VNRSKRPKANRFAAVAIIVQSNDKADHFKIFQELQPKSKQQFNNKKSIFLTPNSDGESSIYHTS
jgi:hypothetical protein